MEEGRVHTHGTLSAVRQRAHRVGCMPSQPGWPQNDVKVLICSGTCDERAAQAVVFF